MRTSKLLLAALITAVALGLAVGTSSANKLSVSEDDWETIWQSMRFSGGGSDIACSFTLLGSFHSRTIAKVLETLISHVTHARISGANCAEGTATVLTETLPWHLQYNGFNGILPNFTGVRLKFAGLAMRVSEGVSCLFRTESAEPFGGIANLSATTGQINSIRLDESFEIDLDTPTFLCELAGDASFSGTTSKVSTLTGSLVFVDLISNAGELTASPRELTVNELEGSGRITIRNVGIATVTIDDVLDESADEFDVAGCERGSTISASGSCIYTVTVDDRPLASGNVTINYDDGVGGTGRLSIPVDIRGEDPLLRASLAEVAMEEREQNEIVAVRNETEAGATITRVVVEAADAESPEFSVSSPGCRNTLGPSETCNYVITPTDRPEDDGRFTIHYRGATGGELTLAIAVDIGGTDNEADLRANPTSVAIERLESNDSFTLRNEGTGTAAAIIDDIVVVTDDTERPEFSVSEFGCSLIFIDGASCTYIVSVNSRPEADGRVIFEYDDGFERTRSVTVEVDIAS